MWQTLEGKEAVKDCKSHQPLCPALSDVLVGQINQNLKETEVSSQLKKTNGLLFIYLFTYKCLSLNVSKGVKVGKVCTFPRRPLCLERRPPPFFTATSRVRLCSSTRETLNSCLNGEKLLVCIRANRQTTISKELHPLLIEDRVEVFLYGVSFPPARPPFVREQVEADVRI